MIAKVITLKLTNRESPSESCVELNGSTNPCKFQPSEELRSTNRESDLPDSHKEWFDNPLRLATHESDSHDHPDSCKEPPIMNDLLKSCEEWKQS